MDHGTIEVTAFELNGGTGSVAHFGGMSPAETKRRKSGEKFLISAEPYKPTTSFKQRQPNGEIKVIQGDVRKANVEYHGWTGLQAEFYLKYLHFDPNSMLAHSDAKVNRGGKNVPKNEGNNEDGNVTGDVAGHPRVGELVKFNVKDSLDIISKTDDKTVLAAWEWMEAQMPTPRKSIVEALKTKLG